MENRILTSNEAQTVETYVNGRDFVHAVAKASSKEELKRILNDGGIHGFQDAQLEACYKGLALSQDWKSVSELFHDKDFESCRRKLAAHGITTTRENFDLINDIITAASNDTLIKAAMTEEDLSKTEAMLRENGCSHITADFLDTLRINAAHLNDDGILTQEDIKAMKGDDFWERCSKSLNIVFAMSCITKLVLGLDETSEENASEAAFLIAIASGISLQ